MVSGPLPVAFHVSRVDTRAQSVLRGIATRVIEASTKEKTFPRLSYENGLWIRTRLSEAMTELAPHVMLREQAVETHRSGDRDVAYASGVMASLDFLRTIIDQMTEE